MITRDEKRQMEQAIVNKVADLLQPKGAGCSAEEIYLLIKALVGLSSVEAP